VGVTNDIGRMFQQAFKNIDDVLRKEAGCTTELDYTEQTSWLLFLKYLDDLEQDLGYRGRSWREALHLHPRQAVPLGDLGGAEGQGRGKLDHNKALTGDDLIDFVDDGSSSPTCTASSRRASGAEHDRVQDRGDLRRDKEQDPERLQPARDHRPHRRAPLPFADGEARAFAPVRGEDQADGERRPQRRRVLHPAPADPRDDPGGQAASRRAASTTAPAARPASSVRL
jgi:hypothetical protein